MPRSSFSRSNYGASGVAVLLTRAKWHAGDAGEIAIGVNLEVGGVCLEQSHLECTVVSGHKKSPSFRQGLKGSHAPGFQGLNYPAVLLELALEIHKADDSQGYCDCKSTVEAGCAK